MKLRNLCITVCFLLLSFSIFAQGEETKKDSTKKATKELPLEPERSVAFSTDRGTWMSLDVSPDGNTLVFDLMGDLYTLPVSGGKAEALTQGMAYEVHPRYSPDGKSLVYISDKSGSQNIWIMDLDSKEETQLTKDNNQNYFSADWSVDGDYIVGSKGRRNAKLYIYHKDGGKGNILVSEPKNLKAIDPAIAADGKLVYFSRRTNAWNYNAQLPQYQIGTYSMEDGKMDVVTSRYGSAFTPTTSPDGKWLAYGTRFEDETGLRLRNLKTGDERWLAYPVQRDEQESIAPLGVLPAMAFSPDSQTLYASYGGKIMALSVTASQAREIPFTADVAQDLGPRLDFDYPISDDPQFQANQIRDAVPSPDGLRLAFTALNRLYIMDLPNGTPRRLTNHDFTEAQPVWSPDGESIVFTSWQKGGGHLYKVNTSGRTRISKLTQEPGIYWQPAWSFKQDKIVLIKGDAQVYRDAFGPRARGAANDLVWISANGGPIQHIARAEGRGNPHFTKVDDRIYLSHPNRGLLSIRWDGTDEKQHLILKGITTYGSRDILSDHHDASLNLLPAREANREPTDQASRPSKILIAPDGKTAMAHIIDDIYTVTIPRFGKTPTISLAKAENASFPAVKLNILGGEFPSWSADSKKVHWSLGSSHFVYNLAAGEAHRDSLEAAKKAEKDLKDTKKENDSTKTDTPEKAEDKKEDSRFKPREIKVRLMVDRDTPQGEVALVGGRIITMKGNEVIEEGTILIRNNRIVAVGSNVEIPASAEVIDVSGKTLSPGFIDTHAHMWPNWGLHKDNIWMYAANLAYGVTTTRDPQTATTDVLTYGDMVQAGNMPGPRIYSTGPGVGFWRFKIQSLDHAKEVLEQYSEYYNTKTIKMYLVGNRQHRQWIIMAAKELKLMPTTEGGLDFKLNMTQLLDGYPGHEHSLPIYPIYEDVVKVTAESKMAVTPTLLVAYGGPWAENYYYATEDVWGDQKLQRFTPYEELAQKSRRRPGWFMEEEHVFKKHAEFMNDLVKEGGLAGVGSHGQLQGLGYHWELWSVASGGMNNHDALKVATIHGAEAIGLETDLGTLEQGKLADIVVMDGNPLEDLRNTNTLKYVVKNGRVYKADTLDEIWPRKQPATDFNWATEKPENIPGLKE